MGAGQFVAAAVCFVVDDGVVVVIVECLLLYECVTCYLYIRPRRIQNV